MKLDDQLASAIRNSLAPLTKPLQIIAYASARSKLQIAVIVRNNERTDFEMSLMRFKCCMQLVKPVAGRFHSVHLALFLETESSYSAQKQEPRSAPNLGFFEAARDGIVIYKAG